MAGQERRFAGGSSFAVFRSVRNKLLTLVILLSLVPLVGISTFSYFIGSKQIAEDRIKLSLEKMAQDAADKIDLVLRQTREEGHSMASSFPLIYSSLSQNGIIRLLNNYCFNHEAYDVLLVVGTSGNIIGINSTDRYRGPLPVKKVSEVLKSHISEYPEEKRMFDRSIAAHSSQYDWYQSTLVQSLYAYQNEDISHQYNLALSEPLQHPITHEIIGVWISIINWSYIQNILDTVETDLANLNLKSGYAFMFAKDADTIIAHKYRKNRAGLAVPVAAIGYSSLYRTKLVENHGLKNLHDAILRHERSCAYEFPRGNRKISGLAPIEEISLGWIVGVGIDNADIFRPIKQMTWWIVGATVFLAFLVVFFTYLIARGITVPLNNLVSTAQTIARGDLSQRVQVRSSDEIGVLGATFNDMARALAAREEELQELNKNLEDMVRQRTKELEESHEALKKAYVDLQNAQQQLVQTEKMASLGQLVAGIAHEIKNPLNFIYGNTGFLADYAKKLEAAVEFCEQLPSVSTEDHQAMEEFKETINYSFIKKDLHILIDNFTEGAHRINNIVSDLRTFSRMDADVLSEVDLHTALEMSLNLLRNQYKDRVEIHREYGDIPKIRGYSGKISQVFMNLLSNAFHAVEGGGDVWIRTRSSNTSVEVEIEDNGVGISKEHLNRIFEPFFTTKPVGQGTGLGLSISYGIVDQHHGTIYVKSEPHKGTVFTVRLPILQEKAE